MIFMCTKCILMSYRQPNKADVIYNGSSMCLNHMYVTIGKLTESQAFQSSGKPKS